MSETEYLKRLKKRRNFSLRWFFCSVFLNTYLVFIVWIFASEKNLDANPAFIFLITYVPLIFVNTLTYAVVLSRFYNLKTTKIWISFMPALNFFGFVILVSIFTNLYYRVRIFRNDNKIWFLPMPVLIFAAVMVLGIIFSFLAFPAGKKLNQSVLGDVP